MDYDHRESKGKKIGEICRAFFKDERHLAYHFSYVTDVSPLNDEIQKNFATFMGKCLTFFLLFLISMLGHLEVYLKDVDRSIESKKDLREIELVCEMEMNGSRTLKDLHLLVSIGGVFISCNGVSYCRGRPPSTSTSRTPAISSSLSQIHQVKTPALTCWPCL